LANSTSPCLGEKKDHKKMKSFFTNILNLHEQEAEALYKLRCSLVHDFSLYAEQGGKNENNLTFLLTQNPDSPLIECINGANDSIAIKINAQKFYALVLGKTAMLEGTGHIYNNLFTPSTPKNNNRLFDEVMLHSCSYPSDDFSETAYSSPDESLMGSDESTKSFWTNPDKH